jgi:hypothetical protein
MQTSQKKQKKLHDGGESKALAADTRLFFLTNLREEFFLS